MSTFSQQPRAFTLRHPPTYVSSRHGARHTDHYLYNQLIPYLGNKRKLLPLIARAVEGLCESNSIECNGSAPVFADMFAGSGVVSRLAKWMGFRTLSNDWEPYAAEINRCFVAGDRLPAFRKLGGARAAFDELNALDPVEGYFATYYAPRDDARPDPDRERMFFTHSNAARLDAIRARIAQWESDGAISRRERSVLLAALVYSVSYVSNTSGVFKGFHYGWGGAGRIALYRILSDLELRPPVLHDSGVRGHRVYRQDANRLARRIGPVDVAYLDPPYNQHPYGSNYHLLNTVVLDDRPPLERSIVVGGKITNKSAIRTDWRQSRRSKYCVRTEALGALEDLVTSLDARHILVSYSRDGFIGFEEMARMLSGYGEVTAYHQKYKRYRVSPTRPSPRGHTRETVFVVKR